MATVIDEVRAEVVTDPPATPEPAPAARSAEADSRRLLELLEQAAGRAHRVQAD